MHRQPVHDAPSGDGDGRGEPERTGRRARAVGNLERSRRLSELDWHAPGAARDSSGREITALRRLWRGERHHPPGAYLQEWSTEAYLRAGRPARDIPIYVGAMSPRMLRLIGERADGGLPLLFPPEHFTEAMTHMRQGAAAAGRSVDEVDVAACIWCSIADEHHAAEQVLREKLAYYGHAFSPAILARVGLSRADFEPIQQQMRLGHGDAAAALVTPDMLRLGMVGTAVSLIPRLEHLVDLGARHLSFGPPLGPDLFEAIDALGRDVLPHFRDP